MPVDPQTGIWLPRLSPKQMEVFNATERYLLVSGPRMSGKTLGVLHRIVRHLWETPGARVAMFTKTIKNAKSGVWADLVDMVIPEWLDGGMSSPHATFEYTVEPKIDGATRMHHFKIRNYWGGESTLQLHSLDYDGDIEQVMFGTRFSLIYFAELQHFQSKAIFDAPVQQLRMPHLSYDQHQWIGDTNPPEDATEHFAYDLWFIQRNMKDHPDPRFQKQLRLIEISILDNPFLDPRQIEDLKSTYRFDPDGWDRFVLGKWTGSGGHAGKHFSKLFSYEHHVAGKCEGPDASRWEFLNPLPDTQNLITGWDTGEVNHSFHIIQKRWDEKGQSHFDVLDELVSTGEMVTLEEFAEAALGKMEETEALLYRPPSWRHWSDTSVFRFQSSGKEMYDALLIEKVSGGKIQLQGAFDAKGKGSVRKRVQLIKQLLGENRILVSAHCTNTIQMFRELKKGKTELDYVQRGQKFKHPFDSLSYVIFSEMLEELELNQRPQTGTRLIYAKL